MSVRFESGRGPVPILWMVALLASVLAHAALFRLNPKLLSGPESRLTPTQSRQRPSLEVVPPEPQLLREELPRLLDRVEPDQSTPDPTLPDVPQELSFQAPGAEDLLPDVKTVSAPAPLAELEPADTGGSSEWSPREEVLAITETRVRETLDVLPRTFREVEATRPGAPDLTLPSERPDLLEIRQTGDDPLQAPSMFPGTASAGIRGGGGAGRALLPPPPTTEILTPPPLPAEEVERLPDEKDFIPTEDLLKLSFRVYDPPKEPEARYFKIQLMRNGIESLPMMPRDVVYLIDCSASMTEAKLQLALEGVRASLDLVQEPDRVQVIAFRNEVEVFAPEPRPATVFVKAQVRTFLSTLRARGQTDVFASLEALSKMPSNPKRPILALVITDGVPTQGVTRTGDILEKFSRANDGRISVFGLGGGERVNRQLLDFLSFRNRGFSLISSSARGLRDVIPQAGATLGRPVLTDLEVRFTGETPPEVYPTSLSHLFVDRPWILIGRTDRSVDRMAFQVVGSSLESEHDILFEIDFSDARSGGPQLREEWAWQAGLERWAAALLEGTPAAFRRAAAFFRNYGMEIPEAYQN